MRDLHDLEPLLKSRVPNVVIETHEEARVLKLFDRIGARLRMTVYRWTVTEGIRELNRLPSHDLKAS